MSAVARAAAVRREMSAARHIPYTAQVGEYVIRTDAGDYVQAIRFGGVSFESADDEDLNNWHERLNVTLRNIASPNLALWVHVIRRRETLPALAVHERRFCRGAGSEISRAPRT